MRARDDLAVSLVVGGSHLLPDSGETVRDISKDHKIDARVYTVVEGETPQTMSKSIGLGCIEFATVFDQFKPDVVMLHGDRFDIFPAAIAAAMSNIHIAHLQGGEVTGTIDESVRHSITKLAHLHFVSNQDAAIRVAKLGEDARVIFNVGCPSVDALRSISYPSREAFAFTFRATYGGVVNLREPYVLLIQHPVTTEFGDASKHMERTIESIVDTGFPTVLIYPNIDAGSKQMASTLRRLAPLMQSSHIDMFKHISTQHFFPLLKYTSCIVGNSSSGIREACYFGTPCVNIGSRQHNRTRGSNVQDVGYEARSIAAAIRAQVQHGPYPVEELYGHGHAAQKIAQTVAEYPLPPIQKTITY